MLSVPKFSEIVVGDCVEVPGLMPGLSKEPLVLWATVRDEDSICFRVSYYGAIVMHMSARLTEGKIKWELIDAKG